jgi:hypothetical protein
MGISDTGDFSVSVLPNTLSVNQGSTGTTTATITSLVNFSGPVTLTISGLPAGVSAAVGTNPLTPPKGASVSSPIVIGVGGSVPATSYPLIVSASNGTLTHSTVLALTVTSSGPSPDFTITISPSSITLPESVSATTTVTITSMGAFSSSVSLTSSGVPSGVILTFGTNPVLPPAGGSVNSAISLILQPWAAPGPYTITVTGTSGSITHTATIGLFIAPVQDYQLTANPSTVSLAQGTSASTIITVSSYVGYNSPIQLSTFWVGTTPYGVSVNTPSTMPPQYVGSMTLTLTISASTTASVGTYTLRVTGVDGSTPHSVDVTVQITSTTQPTQDFTITANPQSVTLVQGSQGSVMVTIQSLGTFSSPVTLSTSGVPAGASAVFSTNSLTPGPGGNTQSAMTITTSTTVTPTTYAIMITGLGGSVFHSTSITLTVTSAATPDFSLSSSKSVVTVTQGQSSTDTIFVTSNRGFNSLVTLSASWMSTNPAGVTTNIISPVVPAPNTSASSTLTISASGSAPAGNFTVRVVGISGTLIDFVDVVVVVNAPQCVVATATYGSTLSPEVQFLRNFRDNMILKTTVGSNFMLAFNIWYYSFSPNFAQFIAANPPLKNTMRYALYPMISILEYGASTFYVVPSNPEASAVISGLIISSLIGATYLALPLAMISLCARRVRVTAKKLEKPAAAGFIGGLVSLALAEIAGTSSVVLTIAASVLVLASITISGLLASRLALRTVSAIRRKF